MKPDWEDAPKWANWLAMDDDGWWYWYKSRPWKEDGEWVSNNRTSYAGQSEVNHYLESRP